MPGYAFVIFDEDGNLSFRHSPDVALIVIDERCPDDRVYCCNLPISDEEAKRLIGSSPIGHLDDDSGHTERSRRLFDGDAA